MGTGSGLPVAVLAVDAGNSKTDVALVASDGTVLGQARGGPFLPQHGRVDTAVSGLEVVIAQACADAGLPVVFPLAEQVVACLANVDLPSEERAMEIGISTRHWGLEVTVLNDTFALLRCGQDEMRGVAVVCGAGINCVGAVPDVGVVRFAAVGQISGDWGGGGQLWREAMWSAARAEDGRGADTSLRQALPAHYGLDTMAELIEQVHLGLIPGHRCLEMTPLLFEVADQGDPIAVDLVHRQAAEIVDFAVAALRRLDALDQHMDVVLGGGVLTGDQPLLLHSITEQLRIHAPFATAQVVDTPPVVGAALIGLERVGGDDVAQKHLREQFAN